MGEHFDLPRLKTVLPQTSTAFTPAETRVLKEMLQGSSNGAIANHFSLSRRTVEGHVSAMLQKTGCRSRTQLVLWALERA